MVILLPNINLISFGAGEEDMIHMLNSKSTIEKSHTLNHVEERMGT